MIDLIHGENIIYVRIDWENYPSEKTPVNDYNLNKMDLALHLLDERVVWLNENKFDRSESFKLIKNIDLDEETGIFTITYYDNTTKTIDTILEKVATNWDYDKVSQQLVITLDDGTVKNVDLSALITQYEFMTSDTISFEVQPDGKVKAIVREGSIQEKHLRPDYLADIRIESSKAEMSSNLAGEKALDSENSALMSKSYSDGDSGVREGEETDNAKYYSEQAKIYYDNLQQAGTVTGVKGDSETEYRGGNVNLTAEDVGALPISGGTMTGRIQIPSKALNWNEGKELSNAAIGIIRPYSPNAYFSVIADKTVSNYIWSLGSIQDEVGIYGYTKDGATPHWKFAIDAATGNITTGGGINANGQILCHGSYNSSASGRFSTSAIQVRENNLVTNTQSDIGYAPSIGFHWANAIAGTLCLGIDGKFRFLGQSGNTGTLIANLEGNASTATTATKATQDGSGNVITNTYAKKSIYGDTSVSLGRKSGTTVGTNSFAAGYNVEASSSYSHAEGYSTTASSSYSHAEGYSTTASSSSSHAEGSGTTANGTNSHAEGGSTTANGYSSHAEGSYTTASNYASHACGKYNKSMVNGGSSSNQTGDAFVIGNGTGNTSRSNALRVTYKGDILGTKAFQSSGADYAEFIKPWADGNPDNEDRVGYFVTIKNGHLHKANEGDYITGITSGNPSVVGNADEDYYWRYERDNFNRIVMEDVPETVQAADDEGKPLFDEETHEPIMVETGNIIPNARMKLAKDYDPSLQESYVERKDRKEWDYVGMLGVLPVRDDGSCIPGQFCRCKIGGIATLSVERNFDTYMVLERISDNIVSVILK